MGADSEPLICGVSQSQLEEFLRLIRDGYPKADDASFFLEVRAGISNVPNMANVRDTLSHLVTFLDPELDITRRADQISDAEEHLRRAIIEPYQVAVEDLFKRIDELYGKYKASLLPVREKHPALSGSPNEIQVDARLRHIKELLLLARKAKRRNRWDEEWENGVANYILAFDELETLHSELERYWHRFEQLRTGKHHTRLHFVIGIGTFVLAIAIDYLAHHFGWW